MDEINEITINFANSQIESMREIYEYWDSIAKCDKCGKMLAAHKGKKGVLEAINELTDLKNRLK